MTTPVADRFEQQERLLNEWVAVRQQINQLEARAAAVLADRVTLFDEDVAEQPLHRDAIWRSMIAAFSAAGRIAGGSAEYAFVDAVALRAGDFPALQTSFESGTVSAAHVREVLRAASPVIEAITHGDLDPTVLGVYDAAATVFAEDQSVSRTRAHVREVAATLAGSTVVERQTRARSERSVTVRSAGDGLALLQVVLPEHLAVAIHDRLTQMARHQKQHPEDRDPRHYVDEDALDVEAQDPRHLVPELDSLPPSATATSDATIFGDDDTFTTDPFRGDCDAYWKHVDAMIEAGPQPVQLPSDDRTLDQIRADLLSDLLLSATPSAIHGSGLDNITARIQVTVSASTLAGADDRPALLDGHGELHPDVARDLAGRHTGWTRLFLDPTGLVTETDTYTPTEPMRRFLRARDQHCRFPGCRMPVHRCETDHTHDFALGGPTSIDNLAHLCKTHHVLKHPDIPEEHRWRARQLPNGDLEWTSPLGATHRDSPPRRVMFVPSDELNLSSETPISAPF